jgi:hypothetical protein
VLKMRDRVYTCYRGDEFMRKADRDKITKLLNKNMKPAEIASTLDVPVKRVYNVRSSARRAGELVQTGDNTRDIEKYEPELINNIKYITLDISNTLRDKSFQKESSTQLAKTLGILIDKLRLIEGKSTHNISAQIVASLDEQQLNKLKEIGKSLIESML